MEGTILSNRYLLAEEIGTGGMGNVYRATDLRTGGTVAVKIPHAFLARNPEYIERLRREAQIAASLSSARIVRVMDLDSQDGTPFLVMEYVPGETLADELKARGRFPLADTLLVGLEVARALDAAHARGIVHRDLKPQNIKLVHSEVKVLDFGIAKAEGFSGMTAASIFMGTPEYCAPERGEGLGDIRSDIYSLGIIMFEMYEGYLPFQALTPMAVMRKHELEPLPALTGDVPESAQTVLRRCLAKLPEDRYQTPHELVQEIIGALRELPDQMGTVTPLATPRTGAPTPATGAAHVTPTLVQPSIPSPPRTSTPPAPHLDSGGVAAPAPGAEPLPARALPVAASAAVGGVSATPTPQEHTPPPGTGVQNPGVSVPGTDVLPARVSEPGHKHAARWPWLLAAAVVLLSASGALLLRNRTNDPSPGVPVGTPTAIVAVVPPSAAPATPVPNATLQPTAAPSPSAPPAPTPAPTLTPEPGPPGGIALTELAGEEREVARAVNNANIALIDRVLRRVDAAPLAQFYSGDALATYQKFVNDLRADGRYARAELKETTLQSVRIIGPTNAEVRTRERWSYDEFTTANNQRVVGAGYDADQNETYLLQKRNGRWLVQSQDRTFNTQTLR